MKRFKTGWWGVTAFCASLIALALVLFDVINGPLQVMPVGAVCGWLLAEWSVIRWPPK